MKIADRLYFYVRDVFWNMREYARNRVERRVGVLGLRLVRRLRYGRPIT